MKSVSICAFTDITFVCYADNMRVKCSVLMVCLSPSAGAVGLLVAVVQQVHTKVSLYRDIYYYFKKSFFSYFTGDGTHKLRIKAFISVILEMSLIST